MALPYKGLTKKEIKSLLKKSRTLTSFGGTKYEEEHKKTVDILLEQKQRSPEALRKIHEDIIGSDSLVRSRKIR